MTDWVLAAVPAYGPWLVAFVTFLSCLALPVPASVLMLAAGGFAAAGDVSFAAVASAALLGAVAGDQTGFWAARLGGPVLLARLEQDSGPAPVLAQARVFVAAPAPQPCSDALAAFGAGAICQSGRRRDRVRLAAVHPGKSGRRKPLGRRLHRRRLCLRRQPSGRSSLRARSSASLPRGPWRWVLACGCGGFRGKRTDPLARKGTLRQAAATECQMTPDQPALQYLNWNRRYMSGTTSSRGNGRRSLPATGSLSGLHPMSWNPVATLPSTSPGRRSLPCADAMASCAAFATSAAIAAPGCWPMEPANAG